MMEQRRRCRCSIIDSSKRWLRHFPAGNPAHQANHAEQQKQLTPLRTGRNCRRRNLHDTGALQVDGATARYVSSDGQRLVGHPIGAGREGVIQRAIAASPASQAPRPVQLRGFKRLADQNRLRMPMKVARGLAGRAPAGRNEAMKFSSNRFSTRKNSSAPLVMA